MRPGYVMKGASALVIPALLGPVTAYAQEAPPDEPPVVTSAPVSPSDMPPPEQPPEPPPDKAHTFLSLEGGYAFQSLYGVPMTGADVSAAVGARWSDFAVGGILEASPAATQDGLQTFGMTLGALFEGRADHFRAGGGLRVGAFNVSRITTTGGLFSLSAGAFARASYDVVDLDDAHTQAIFFIVKGSIDTVGAALFGVNGGLGVRF
ncbi:MAG: hypothetical protein ACLP1X_20400 [Polyangiaceae bacterium]|jgi:hypothetical protein